MPNFTKSSDSISQPKADQSKGIALSTAGTALEGSVALADTVVKSVIKSEVYDAVDGERQKFTTALANTVNFGNPAGPQMPAGANPAGDSTETPGLPVNIMGGGTQSVPDSINKGLNRIAINQEGLRQDKVTPMEYLKNVNEIAKNIRSSHPGYVDFIDTEVAKITGGNPANMVMSQYIDTINSAMATKNKEHDYWRNKIVDSGFPDNDKVLQYYERTGDYNKVAQYLAENNGVRSNLSLKEAAFRDRNNSKETQVKLGEEYANAVATRAATQTFNNNIKYANGDQSAADIADKMTDLSLHPEKANDAAYQGLSERYAALHTQAYNTTMRMLVTPQKDENGVMHPPVSDTIGMTKVKQIVNDTVESLYGKTRELIADKQFGPAFHLQNQASAMVNNATMGVLQNPTVNGAVLTASVINKLAPNFAPFLTGSSLVRGLSSELGGLVQEQGRQAIAQTGGKYMGTDGKIYSFKQSMEELTAAERITGQPTPGQAINNLIQLKAVFTEPTSTPAAKDNAIKYFYDPVNRGNMSSMMDDYYDPAKRGMVRGRSSAFADLTAPEITQSIWEHGGKNVASNAWVKYSGWAKGEFATQMGTGVRELDDIVRTGGENYKVAYNTETKQFSFKDASGNTPAQSMASWAYGNKLDNLNKGLRSLAEMAKTEGTSVDAYIFRTLKDNGFRPDKDVDGVPSQIMQSLIIANGGKVKK